MYYAPWDWVNISAKVMLVGITPGAYQATEALREHRPACAQAVPAKRHCAGPTPYLCWQPTDSSIQAGP